MSSEDFVDFMFLGLRIQYKPGLDVVSQII